MSGNDSDDAPLSSKLLKRKGSIKKEPDTYQNVFSGDDSDDAPLSSKLLKKNNGIKVKEESDVIQSVKAENGGNVAIKEEDSSDSDLPLSQILLKKKKEKASIKKDKPIPKPKAKSDSLVKKVKNEKEPNKRKPTNGVDSKTKKRAKDVKVKEEDEIKEEEEEKEGEYQWWLGNENGDNSVKWETLEHNGVFFPPEYEPHGVKLIYDGKPVDLPPEAEEVASFFAALIETDYAKNATFVKNFFNDFKEVLKKYKVKTPIEDFKKCDFTNIFNYLQAEKEKKKVKSKEEKQKEKEEKAIIEDHYGYAILNGRKEKVGNFRIEPPNLFRGRGDHPKTGCLKYRVYPEQVTINIGKDAKVPTPPAGHQWGKVVHDNTVTWLATWKENINGSLKYVLFGATSSLKGQSDMKKFEKARELKGCIKQIRDTYMAELKDKAASIRQRATAMYLIDILALRAGNEKGEDEADTVGCCSLRYEHVTLCPPNILKFDFLGKDSIRYVNEVSVIDQVYKNIAIFKKSPKKEGDMIFDRLNTFSLNRHLSNLMPGLSAKVFRTYNASHTFQNELKSTPEDGTIHDKILAYNRANRQVAVLCNHQRSVSKNFETQMGRMDDKIKAMQFQRHRLKLQILGMDKTKAKAYPSLREKDDNFEEFWCDEFVEQLIEKEKEKVKAKYEKTRLLAEENKTKKEGEEIKYMTKQELNDKLKEFEEEKKVLLKEVKTGKVVEVKKVVDVDKLLERLEKLDARIDAANITKVDKDENKTTALGTSKINYIDPRISVAWCAKYKVPLDKIFPKTLRDKFKWATMVDENYKF